MTASQNTPNKPVAEIRDGSMKIALWRHATKDGGARFSGTLSRSYTDEQGNWHDTTSLSNGEYLKAARLLGKAYDLEQELKAQARQEAKAQAGA